MLPSERSATHFGLGERVVIATSVCFRFLFKAGCLWPTEGAKWGDPGERAYQLLTPVVNLLTQSDSHFLVTHTHTEPQVKSGVFGGIPGRTLIS